MFSEILSALEPHTIGIVLVLTLWYILYDNKALDRINSKKFYKRCAYVAIIIYFTLIAVEVIQHILTG